MADTLDLIWTAAGIAAAIGKTPRATTELLEKNGIPGAKKVGGKWVISRKVLVAFFEGEAA